MKSVVCNGKFYKSESIFKKYVKDLIYNKIGLCSSVKNTPYYEELITILERHPRANQKLHDIQDIKIRRNKIGRGLAMYIVNSFDEWISISYNICISGIDKSYESELNSALRYEIDYQIKDFKNSNDNICVKCGSTSNLEVDHIYLFKNIRKDFEEYLECIHNLGFPDKFDDAPDETNRRCFPVSHNEAKDIWKNYHLENANLRILCKSCNLSRGHSS